MVTSQGGGKASPPRSLNVVCPYCNRTLNRIDHYGEVLVGCIDCNRWGRPGDKTLIMELMEDDLEALRQSRGESG
jgi:hypothetical protein